MTQGRLLLVAFGLIGVMGALMLAALGGGFGGSVAATSSPGSSPTQAAVASGSLEPSASLLETAVPSAAPTVHPGTGAPTQGPTTRPSTAPTKTAKPTLKPTAAPTPRPPAITSFTAQPNYITNCNRIEGTTIVLSWTTSRASEVRIAVDPVGEDPMDHIYAQGLPEDDSSDPIFYPCDPPNQDQSGSKYHEYVLIAIEGNRVTTKSIKVFVLTPPT
jgi:hypothetical protein